MAIDMEFASKGRREPRAGLIEQGKVSLLLAQKHAGRLAGAGWRPEDMQALGDGVKALETETSEQAEAKDGSRGKTAAERTAVTVAKAFKRRLLNALPVALRRGPATVTAAVFDVGGPLGRSAAKVSAYLARIAGTVETLDASLKPFFGGRSALEELRRLKVALDAADSEQEVSVSSLPTDTLQVYEAKGRVLTLIEDLNRIGRIAFDGEPAAAAQFNKDVLVRARQQKKSGPPAGGAAGGGPGPG